MALTRKLLKSMGIDDEKIDQIIEAHTETVDALKDERDKFRESAEKLPEIQKKLDAAQKANSGDESFEAKYNALKEEHEKYKSEVTAKETKGAKETALKRLMKKARVAEKGIDIGVKIIDPEKIKLDKENNISNADEIEKMIRDELDVFIVTEGEKKPTPETPPTSGGKTPMTREDIMKIKDTSERQAAIAENLELFGG